MFRSKALGFLCALLLAFPAEAQLAQTGAGKLPSGGGRPTPTLMYTNGTLTASSGVATLNPTAGCTAGQTAVAILADNLGRASVSVGDNAGSNIWTLVKDGFQGGNIYSSYWKSTLASTITTSTTVTVTYNSLVTQAQVIIECLGTTTLDATGNGLNAGGTSSAPATLNVTTSASPPTNAARVYMTVADMGDYSSATVSDPVGPGWTLATTAMVSSDYGFHLYYQDVGAGVTSQLNLTHTGQTIFWGALWASFD